ncbi:MAG: pyruvate kinase [Gammaproteobacteria bacterium]|nr:pyruvate kinase [Gammaproteobacteria bacterium]
MSEPHTTTALHWRRTKIIATLGPASSSLAAIERLIKAGANVFRLNLSHGDHDSHRQLFARVRRCAKKLRQPVAILMDLCGPKIRVGRLADGQIKLVEGQAVTVTCRNVMGGPGLIPSQYRTLYRDVTPSERIFLDDGHFELLIEAVEEKEIRCRVIFGGTLKEHKGMNLPDSRLTVAATTAKDRRDAALAVELGADFIALSFVRRAIEVAALQRLLAKLGREIPIIAKIEKPEAVENIEAILQQAYGIMIARGDLGIELPAERVPLIQRELIRLARRHHRPVIVATQMLESMITRSRPTRAEVGDVANAALLGTDAVMLSAETASGRYPVKALGTMDRILREMEQYQWQHNQIGEPLATPHEAKLPLREAVARAATSLAESLKLQGILIPTSSGLTAQIIAAARPTAPCMGITTDERVSRRLCLHWGIVPVTVTVEASRNWRELSEQVALSHHLLHSGGSVLLVSGFSDDPSLNEPVLKIMHLTEAPPNA